MRKRTQERGARVSHEVTTSTLQKPWGQKNGARIMGKGLEKAMGGEIKKTTDKIRLVLASTIGEEKRAYHPNQKAERRKTTVAAQKDLWKTNVTGIRKKRRRNPRDIKKKRPRRQGSMKPVVESKASSLA